MILPKVISIKVNNLILLSYDNLEDWLKKPSHISTNINMTRYVKGATESKWANKFSIKKYGRDGCIKKYEKWIRESDLINQINELNGFTLGCWCKPDDCHGNILVKLFKEKNLQFH